MNRKNWNYFGQIQSIWKLEYLFLHTDFTWVNIPCFSSWFVMYCLKLYSFWTGAVLCLSSMDYSNIIVAKSIYNNLHFNRELSLGKEILL